jgi:tetratricopeptide (TPR) repeat protein
MFSNTHREWLSEYSNIQEELGIDPSYPLTAIQMHIKKELENQNQIIKYSSENLSKNIVAGIENSTSAITGTLENGFNALIETNSKGFNQVSSDLNGINNTLNNISGILDWGFSETIEQIKTSNILLGNIAVLLKIAEFEKESEAYIKEGMKFFKNAMFNKKRYSDALENFLLAEKVAKRNYFLLQKIGLVYLFSKEHLNIDLALQYFLKASDYSLDETRDNSAKTTNFLNIDVSEDFNNYTTSVLSIKSQTAYSYIYAGRCYYLQKQYSKALEYATKANTMMPNILEASYDMAKYNSVLNDVDKSIEILDEIIAKDKFISLKVINDFDLISKPKVVGYLESLRKNTVNELETELSHFQLGIDNNIVKSLVNNAKSNFKLNKFLQSKISIENLNKQYEFELERIIPIDKERHLYTLEKNNIISNPKKIYNYTNFISGKKETLLRYSQAYSERNIANDKLKYAKENFKSTKGQNVNAKGDAWMGFVLIAIGVIALYFIFTLDSILAIIGWLIFLGIPLGYFVLHGGIHFFNGLFSLKGGQEQKDKTVLENHEKGVNNINQKMVNMLVEIKAMELEKLEKIL